MYRYKLNNSYTIYVNYTYINDCIKASKGKHTCVPVKPGRALSKNAVSVPFAINTRMWHKVWGEGKLIATEKNGVMTISFADRVTRFVYPDAFTQGHLVRV